MKAMCVNGTPVEDYHERYGLFVKREDTCCPNGPHFSKTCVAYYPSEVRTIFSENTHRVGDSPRDVATISVPAIEPRARDYAKELLDRVRYLRDTYVTPYDPSGVAPTPQAFNDAESFIRLLPLNRTQMPTINVASDGEVNFCWSSDTTHIDLGFFGNGTYSYYGRSPAQEVIGENIMSKSGMPDELVKIAAA